MPYIRIKFNSAKLRSSISKKDKGRYEDIDFNNLIRFECVSNMLHALLGARPKNSSRESCYSRIQAIDDIVKTGYYKLYNNINYTDKKGKIHIIQEWNQAKTPLHNSYNKAYMLFNGNYINGEMSWSLLRRMLIDNSAKYDDIIEHLKTWCNNEHVIDEYDIIDALAMLQKSEYKNEAISYFKSLEMSSFVDIINENYKTLGEFNKRKFIIRTINTKTLNSLTLNGELIFEVTSEELINFYNGDKLATFLDNGIAEFTDVIESDTDIDFDEYTKIINN